MADELLTVDEVAARLKVNPQSVRNWIDRGSLPSVRAGERRVRIRSVDLDRFLGTSGIANTNVPVARPGESARDRKAIAALVDRMFASAARLPFDSLVGRELAESAGRIHALLLRAEQTDNNSRDEVHS